MATLKQKQAASRIVILDSKSLRAKEIFDKRTPAVYIIRCIDWYKIGISSMGINSRIKAMKTGNPFPIIPVYAIHTNRNKELEEALHKHFKDRPKYREWVRLELEDEKRIDEFVDNFLYGKETNS